MLTVLTFGDKLLKQDKNHLSFRNECDDRRSYQTHLPSR